jgi:dTDP-4-amino-4,6-dideoxygalactose transaminase
MIERHGSHTGKYPVSEKTSKEVLTLPSWPYQTAQDIEYTINTVKEFYS